MNQAEVFRASFDRAVAGSGYNEDFIARFYVIFLAKSPEIGRLFENTNMSMQKTMLHDSLNYLAEFFERKVLSRQLMDIARIHGQQGRNVPPKLYDWWLESLVEAVREFDSQFDSNVELAWRVAMSPGIAYMKHIYNKGEGPIQDPVSS